MKLHSQPPSTVVLVGSWNTSILFNPKWLSKYVFDGQTEYEIQLPVDNISRSQGRRIKCKGNSLTIELLPGRLNLIPNEITEASLYELQEITQRICDTLIHTPVCAFGINFSFISERELFPKMENLSIIPKEVFGEEIVVEKTLVSYKLKIEGIITNIQIDRKNENESMCFINFHHDITELSETKRLLDKHDLIFYFHKAQEISEKVTQYVNK